MTTAETRIQHWRRRAAELSKHPKGTLVARYRELGGLGGVHPPEKWRKDELVSSIVDIEWSRLPEERKLPDPPVFDPPCDTCGKGYEFHPEDHHYCYTAGNAHEDVWICRTCTKIRIVHVDDRCPTAEDLATAEAVTSIFAGDSLPVIEDQDQDGPPCGRCGDTPAQHLGWAKGHLWVRQLAHQTRPAEVQPHGADATVAAVTEESGDHQDVPDVPCTGADCDRECSTPTPPCPSYPQWAREARTKSLPEWDREARMKRLRRQGSVYADQDPDLHLVRPVTVPCDGEDCTGCTDPSCRTARADGGDV